jgi:hypothetical protein
MVSISKHPSLHQGIIRSIVCDHRFGLLAKRTRLGVKGVALPYERRHYCLDLETVPDLQGFAAANGLVGKTNDEIRESVGDKFPKHIYHSVVCIGALIAHRDGQLMRLVRRTSESELRRNSSPLSLIGLRN